VLCTPADGPLIVVHVVVIVVMVFTGKSLCLKIVGAKKLRSGTYAFTETAYGGPPSDSPI